MNIIRQFRRFGLLFALLPTVGFGAIAAKPSLLGKFFVNAVSGPVTCVTDGRVVSPGKGDTFLARGTVIETGAGAKAALLFSNQTSVIVDENTRFEVEKFEQEFFPPNNNLRVEPSNSATAIQLVQGRVLISTPTLRSGTTMAYRTAHATIWIRGEKVVIETNEKQTHVVVIAGAVTIDSRSTGGPSVVIGKRLITGEEALLTNGGSTADGVAARSTFQMPPPKRKPAKENSPASPITIQIPKTEFSLSSTSGGVLLTSSTRVLRLPGDGTINVRSSNDQASASKSIQATTASDPELPTLLRASLNAITAAVQRNSEGLSVDGVSRLMVGVASAAAAALPAEAPTFAVEAVTAVNNPNSTTFASAPAATASVIAALVSSAPTAAVQIASAAAAATPEQAVVIAAAAAKAAPTQAAQIAFAVTQTFLQNSVQSPNDASSLRKASAVAAAVTTSAPDQAALIAASVLQAVLVPSSPEAAFANAERAATIAAAVAASAPASAMSAIVASVFSVLNPALKGASAQAIAQAIATLSATVAAIAPAQAEAISSTIVRAFLQAYPTVDAETIAQTTGLLAATMSKVAPAQTAAINSAIAAASNQSVASVQAQSARSTALAAQISEQISTLTHAAGFAAEASIAAVDAIAAGAQLLQPATTLTSALIASQDDVGTPSNQNDSESSPPSGAFFVSQFDPSSFAAIAADLDAAQAAQTSVQFNTETEDDGTFTLRPTPTTPPNLPVEFVTSPANGTG